MNWGHFKDPVSHLCLSGVVVTSWFLTQDVAGSHPFDDKYLIFIFAEFSENI